MEVKYTPGPWGFSIDKENQSEYNITSGKWYVAVCCDAPGDGTAEWNARRIVACVNACEGILTEALECQSKRKISESWLKQRDAMLDALRMAESFIAKFEDDDDYTDGQVETINAIRSAIAKATA